MRDGGYQLGAAAFQPLPLLGAAQADDEPPHRVRPAGSLIQISVAHVADRGQDLGPVC